MIGGSSDLEVGNILFWHWLREELGEEKSVIKWWYVDTNHEWW